MHELIKPYFEKCKTGWLGRDFYNEEDMKPSIPILYSYALQCDHITEFGVRWVCSTWIFAAASPKTIISYDTIYEPEIDWASNIINKAGINFKFHHANSIVVDIEETDLLFIDTDHFYKQLIKELHKHENKVRKFIIAHDTECVGMWQAIEEFLAGRPQWVLEKRLREFGGLTVLKRDSTDDDK